MCPTPAFTTDGTCPSTFSYGASTFLSFMGNSVDIKPTSQESYLKSHSICHSFVIKTSFCDVYLFYILIQADQQSTHVKHHSPEKGA